MLEYDRIDISEGTDVNKTNVLKECSICHYCILKMLFLKMKIIFVMDVMIWCKKHWVFMILLLFMLKGMLAEFIFWYMSKDDEINIMNGSNLVDKKGVL